MDFSLFEIDGVDFSTGAVSATGDINLNRDEAAAEELDADAFVDEGTGYSLVLSAAEMTAKRIHVHVVDQGTKVWLDAGFVVETYGHASAMHIFNLDVAVQDVNVTAMAAGTVTAAAIADAAIDNATFAADVGSTAYATNIIALAVRKVLDELNLDHLMKVAVGDGTDLTPEVVDETVLSLALAIDGDTSTFDSTTDALEAIRNATTGGGASLPTATVTVKNTNGAGAVVSGVTVVLYDSANSVRKAQGLTNVSGIATINVPADGTYKVRLYKNTWTQTTNPETLVVSGDTADEYYMTEWSASAPGSETTCTYYGYLVDAGGSAVAGAVVLVEMQKAGEFSGAGSAVAVGSVSTTTDSSGYFEITLLRNENYRLTIAKQGIYGVPVRVGGDATQKYTSG